MTKGIRPILIVLLIVVIAWIGFSLYFNNSKLNIDPNAASYINPLNSKFDTKGFDLVIEKTEKNLPVSPDSFTILLKK